ncbi:hypothetical protein LOTGIDRAFT_129240 [Lottia gigantea]|uniref:Rapamycin-insensitive companion of mTOR domain-containing protein n=1 Tax=Lottia gigantea TaxID=225164 RepID=V3Z6N9_LOTGI|nr:hypothetical protein LOTGIDRAFT_129240 [Lottia gigantea]ESO86448.1 hypothetical protein LOTGIDRAFT_129240 [Lottia gigantea]
MANRKLLKSERLRLRRESREEVIKFDPSKDPKDIVKTILKLLISQNNVPTSKKLANLNFFVKVLRKLDCTKEVLGLSECEILVCLRIGLFHEAKEVRAGTLRVVRHLLENQKYVDALFYFNLDMIIARSLDICLENEIERVQAVKLIRKIGQVASERLPATLLYPVIAIGSDGGSEWDRLLRVCLATLCEMVFQNIDAVYKCGGISTILRSILDCHLYPRLNESLTCTIIYLLNHPRTRRYVKANTDLEQLLAPFTDSHFRYSGETSDKVNADEKEKRFIASKMAIISVIRSWPGLIRLCHPEGTALQSLVGILYLDFTDIRKSSIEMLFDLFRLKVPEWSSDFSEALASVDISAENESWKLGEGFVAEEGRSILPHVALSRPNLVENHIALILCSWINAGILEALVEVIVTSEGALFCRSVILLGELLHLANNLLPPNCSSHSHCLPTLIAMASSFDIPLSKRHQASLAISHLDELHIMKKRGPLPRSLFLDLLLQHAGKFLEYAGRHWHLRRDKLCDFYFKKIQTEDSTNQAIKDTHVLVATSYTSWDLILISALLKMPDEKLLRLDDHTYVRFARHLLAFFKPCNGLFAKVDISSEYGHKLCEIGCHFIDFLLKSNQSEAKRLIGEWLSDLSSCISEVIGTYAEAQASLSVQSLHNKLSQYYFLFIGKFTATQRGERYLDTSGVYQKLLELVSTTNQDIYIKLTLSSLNYGRDGITRILLSKALTASNESARLYATKFLRVLLRTGVNGFDVWGLQYLVTQMYDPSQVVAMSALHILDEACDIPANLTALINLRPSFLHLGQKGNMMLCKFLASPLGFKTLMDANFVVNELTKWEKGFNHKYVLYVEELLNEALTTYEKTYHGSFTRRSILKRPKKEVFLPTHLYGQLVQHEEGFDLLQKQDCIQEYFHTVQALDLITDDDIVKLKTALWAVGSIGMSPLGIKWLEEVNIVPEIIKLAEESGVFSIRGTAFYVLGLVATTQEGTDILAKFGWESLCHSREDPWPVLIEKSVPTIDNEAISAALKVDELLIKRSQSDVFTDETLKTDANRNQLEPVPRSNTLPYNTKPPSLLSKTAQIKAEFTPYRLRTFSAEKLKFFTLGNPELQRSLSHEIPNIGPDITISMSPKDPSPNPLESEMDRNNHYSEVSPSPDSGTKFALFQLGSRSLTKDNRGGSLSDGSQKSNSRTNSFNTDSTTSGVGSFDSGNVSSTGMITPTTANSNPTTPSTITNVPPTVLEFKEPIHHSLVQRRLAKLNRVPSLKRRSASPSITAFSPSPEPPLSPFTSYNDALGYAALRTIKRTHTYTFDGEYGQNTRSLYSSFDQVFKRTLSTESEGSADGVSDFATKRNVSTASLPDYDSQYHHLNPAINKSSITLSKTDRFVGLSLPVDVSMVFEVEEGEDARSRLGSCASATAMTTDVSEGNHLSLHLPGLRLLPEYVPPLKKDLDLEHNICKCLVCVRTSTTTNPRTIFRDMPIDDNDQCDIATKTMNMGWKMSSLKESQEDSSNTPKSLSTTDSDSGISKTGDSDPNNRLMVRKEIIRLVINLSSSVGLKGSEQGLLVLKQKFPKAFQDLCFYSEVGQILATYSFRLAARRFAQELFDELDVSPLLIEARSLLGVNDNDSSHMSPIPQGSAKDDFVEFS